MKIKQSLLAAAIGVCIVGQAQAGFYVNDETPLITAAHPEAARRDKTVYASFAGPKLQGTSRAELESTADAIPNPDSLVITTFVRTSKQLLGANRRVASVKAVLIRRGISPDRITASAELDPQADATDTDVQVTFRSSTQRPSLDAIRAAKFVSPAPQPVATPAPAYANAASQQFTPAAAPATTVSSAGTAQQSQNTSKLEFVKKIMAMASSKVISQESAVKLVNEYLANMSPVAGQPADGSASREAMPILPATPQIVPFGEVPRIWTLGANKSLRDNIREWSIAAGYGEPAWNASNLYQITYTSTFTGTFLEVLNQVANAVPSLDFRVSRNARRVDVIDHI
jgi:hypothetical protein